MLKNCEIRGIEHCYLFYVLSGDLMGELYPFFARNFLLPVYDLIRHTSRFKFAHILERTQWLPQKEILHLQQKNLRAVLKHAYETVPFYRRVFKERGLLPDDIKGIKDLVKLPVLTKADIRRYYFDLVSNAYPKNELIPNVSGGTGDQIQFFVTSEQRSWELAAEFRAYSWAGYNFGDKCVVFWGHPLM